MKKACTDKCIMMLFWAEWHEPCHILRDQMGELAKVHKELKFTWVSSNTKYLTYQIVQLR
jgi:thioredoxin-like negative regulator of GroEL